MLIILRYRYPFLQLQSSESGGFIHILEAYSSIISPEGRKLDRPGRMRQPLPHQAGQGFSWSPIQVFPCHFLVADLSYFSSKSAWAFISKQIFGQKCCVSLAFAPWDTLLGQYCKHLAMASYCSDPQRCCNNYTGYLVLWNLLLYRLVISMLELLKWLICGIDGEQLSPRSKPEVSEGIYFGYYGYTSLATQPMFMQTDASQQDVASNVKSSLPLSISRKENPNPHSAIRGGFHQHALWSFCSCLATREEKRRRVWDHGDIWRSRLFLANQLAKSAFGSPELFHCNRLSAFLDECLLKVRIMILLEF